jgi:hypothetical protein
MVTSQKILCSIRSYLNSLLHFRSGWLVALSRIEMLSLRLDFYSGAEFFKPFVNTHPLLHIASILRTPPHTSDSSWTR